MIDIPKVSVIIPVYNAEDSIRKCLDSFMAQTLRGWEMILVDDGTLDKSGEICDEYAAQTDILLQHEVCVRVIHKQNGGVSSARQTGLDAATGEYVIHADPDDWVEPTMLDELYSRAKADGADMVICDFVCDVDGASYYRCQKPSSMQPSAILNDMFGKIHGSCCNKMVRRTYILQHNVNFPCDINYCEDVCFNIQLLKHDCVVSYVGKPFYHYVQNSSSITNNYTVKTLESQKRYVEFLCTQLPEDSEPVKKSKQLIKKLVFRYSLLDNAGIVSLYPEIRDVTDQSGLVRIMYYCAFNGHFWVANTLRYLYDYVHNNIK